MILRKIYLLSITLKEHGIFTWEFFLNRFDTLCLEAQLDLEGTGDISGLQGKVNGEIGFNFSLIVLPPNP